MIVISSTRPELSCTLFTCQEWWVSNFLYWKCSKQKEKNVFNQSIAIDSVWIILHAPQIWPLHAQPNLFIWNGEYRTKKMHLFLCSSAIFSSTVSQTQNQWVIDLNSNEYFRFKSVLMSHKHSFRKFSSRRVWCTFNFYTELYCPNSCSAWKIRKEKIFSFSFVSLLIRHIFVMKVFI